jgi:hypothetical protein
MDGALIEIRGITGDTMRDFREMFPTYGCGRRDVSSRRIHVPQLGRLNNAQNVWKSLCKSPLVNPESHVCLGLEQIALK